MLRLRSKAHRRISGANQEAYKLRTEFAFGLRCTLKKASFLKVSRRLVCVSMFEEAKSYSTIRVKLPQRFALHPQLASLAVDMTRTQL